MKFLKYIQGNRKGKNAHRIEKQAMEDPFLFEAIEGYDSVPGNHADRIARMRSSITARSTHHRAKGAWKIAAATVGIIAASSIYFMMMNHESSMLTAHENANAQITIYIPEEYVEQKRLELTVIQENNPKQKVTLEGTVANITNLDEVISPIEPMVVYLPQNYAHIQNKEIRVLSKKDETLISRQEKISKEEDRNNNEEIEIREVINDKKDLVAQQHEEDSNKKQEVPPHTAASSGTYINQSSIRLVMGTNQSLSVLEDQKEENKEKTTSDRKSKEYMAAGNTSKIAADAASSSAHNQISVTLRGKIVDENNEPLAGASVVKKGTNIGTITDINGEYTLKVAPDDDIALTANLIGFEPIDIPNPTETKIVALKESTSSLDEIVVMGYGSQKKRDITGSVSQIRNSAPKSEKTVPTKPEPIIGTKEYNKYIEKNRTHTKTKQGEVILRFSVDSNGTPTNIEISKSLSESLDNEVIRLLKDGPKWKPGNTTGELKIKY